MAVHSCSVSDCDRYISISAAPGGNPEALENYDAWAFLHAKCRHCHECVCDRCIGRGSQPVAAMACQACGGPLEIPDAQKNARITRTIAEQAWSDKNYVRVADILDMLPLFGETLSPAEQKKCDFAKKRR